MDWVSIATSVIPMVIGIFGSGPWGLIGGLVGLAVAGGGIMYLLKKVNDKRDASDLEDGGAKTGQDAVDMRNQSDENRDYMDKQFEKFKEGDE